jgi:uncharacterized hydantoinase/oxoprolinase family protein
MHDAYQILERFPDEPTRTNTADGKPATRSHARTRLGRMIAADTEDFNHRDAVALATAAAAAQVSQLSAAILKVTARAGTPQTVILSGHGEFLARDALAAAQIDVPIISLAKELGLTVSRCAPAHALAVLARESTAA